MAFTHAQICHISLSSIFQSPFSAPVERLLNVSCPIHVSMKFIDISRHRKLKYLGPFSSPIVNGIFMSSVKSPKHVSQPTFHFSWFKKKVSKNIKAQNFLTFFRTKLGTDSIHGSPCILLEGEATTHWSWVDLMPIALPWRSCTIDHSFGSIFN